MARPDNDRVAQVFDAMALQYDSRIDVVERRLLGRPRQWAVEHARGRVLELAVGTGLNLPLYGPAATEVLGVDISEGMLDLARSRISDGDLDRCEVRRCDVQALDVPDDSVDTVLSTITFCTIPDPLRAATEALRVLVPGGRAVLAEHGPSTSRALTAMMRVVEPISIRFGADHLTRDPVRYLMEAGFVIDEVQRAGFAGIGIRVLAHKPT